MLLFLAANDKRGLGLVGAPETYGKFLGIVRVTGVHSGQHVVSPNRLGLGGQRWTAPPRRRRRKTFRRARLWWTKGEQRGANPWFSA